MIVFEQQEINCKHVIEAYMSEICLQHTEILKNWVNYRVCCGCFSKTLLIISYDDLECASMYGVCIPSYTVRQSII